MTWRGLLVSVRDADEAAEALAGGADIIDVKEPLAGPLGAASVDVIVAVAARVAGMRPWTFAAGELAAAPGDGVQRLLALVDAVRAGIGPGQRPAAVKAGLAGLRDGPWRASLAAIAGGIPGRIGFVGVAYADHHAAVSPPPEDVIDAAAACGCVGVLVDTFDKEGPGLFAGADARRVAGWVRRARDRGLPVALAGRLSLDDIATAAGTGADVVAVRSAACGSTPVGPGWVPGRRTDAVNRHRVREARARCGGTPNSRGISSG